MATATSDRRATSWREVLGRCITQHRVYRDNDERMPISKIEGILNEFPFLESLIFSMFTLFEIFIEKLDEELLMKQACGRSRAIGSLNPEECDLEMAFYVFSADGRLLAESKPMKKWFGLPRRFLDMEVYTTQPPLAQVLSEAGVTEYGYVVEVFTENGKVS